jgi:hypothetical protein
MITKEIMEKYNISESSASTTRKRGWFVKNYARNQTPEGIKSAVLIS